MDIKTTVAVALFCLLPQIDSEGEKVAATADSWPSFRGDTALTGTTPARPPEQPALRWTFEADSGIEASPIIHDNTVYAASGNGTVYALRLHDGKSLWTFETGSGIEAPLLYVKGRIFVGDMDGTLHSLKADSGRSEWGYSTDAQIRGGANWIAGERERLLIGSYDNHIHCVDPAGGERIWTYKTDNYVHGTPGVLGMKVIIGGCDAMVHVINSKDGTPKAGIDAGSYIAASPAIRNNFAYIGHYGGEVLGIDVTAGEVKWRFTPTTEPDSPPAFFSSPAVTATRVIAGGRNGVLYCLARTDGKKIWQFQARRDIDSSPVVAGDFVLFGSRDGRLYMIRFSDGKEQWSYLLGSRINATVAVVDGWIVAGAADGFLYAFGEVE